MSRHLVIFFLCFYLPSALAEAHDQEEYRVLKSLQGASGEEAAVVVREAGHLHGQPYQVELRVRCGDASENPLQWSVRDSFSVCDLSPESVKTNTQGSAVALKAKMADHANFEKQLELGISQPQIDCQQQTTIKKFSLRRLCP